MPNWCMNELVVTGPTEQVQAFRDLAAGEEHNYTNQPHGDDNKKTRSSVLSFHRLDPVPADVLCKPYHEVGYHREVDHWGCKWGSCAAEILCEDPLTYRFDTAWNPPHELMKTVASKFPELTFTLHFEEPGMVFQGAYVFKNGKLHSTTDSSDAYAEEIAAEFGDA